MFLSPSNAYSIATWLIFSQENCMIRPSDSRYIGAQFKAIDGYLSPLWKLSSCAINDNLHLQKFQEKPVSSIGCKTSFTSLVFREIRLNKDNKNEIK